MKKVTDKIFLITAISIAFFSVFLFYLTYSNFKKYTHQMLGQQADLALTFDLAIRKYVKEEIRPVMYDLIGEKEFVPEVMSTSYVARSVFEDVRKEFPEVILKFSSGNPRNPSNQAGPEELKIIRYFNDNPTVKWWGGEITIEGIKYLARFKAGRMEESCLRCHGDPDDAPASLVERYGPVAGFNQTLGEVIALDMVAVPIKNMNENLWAGMTHNLVGISLGLLLFFLILFFSIKFLFTNRLTAISQHFLRAISQTDHLHVKPIEVKGTDEISNLAGSYNTFAAELQGYYLSLEKQIKETNDTNLKLTLEVEERKRAEEALRRAEQKYRGIFENALNGIFQCTSEANLLSANPAFARMLGYDSSDEIISAIFDFKNQVFADPNQCRTLLEILEQGPVINFETSMCTKNGDTRWISLNVRKSRDELNQYDLVEGMAEDITEHKKAEERACVLEEQLIQSQKMESIGRLAGGVSHDFNNILSVILGYTDLALSDIPADDPMAEYLRVIKQSGEKAAALTRQLLVFSRKEVVELYPLALNGLVENMTKMLSRMIPENITLEMNLKAPHGRVMADPGKIEQILMNLVINARDAMPSGGRIIIEVLDEVLDEEFAHCHEGIKVGHNVVLAVSDTGEGMSPEIQNQIFEPFFTTKEAGKGTGLGLATVYGIVKQHKGHILVDSQPNKGSTFRVYLPAAHADITKKKADQTLAKEPRGIETLMVVDDDPIIRRLIVDILEPLGYNLLGAGDAGEALEVLHAFEDDIHLLLTDVIMPGMNGKELAGAVQLRRPGIKVIFMSGYTDDTIFRQGVLRSGINFIQKPISREKLANKLRITLDQEDN